MRDCDRQLLCCWHASSEKAPKSDLNRVAARLSTAMELRREGRERMPQTSHSCSYAPLSSTDPASVAALLALVDRANGYCYTDRLSEQVWSADGRG